jgi:hypothetical protein
VKRALVVVVPLVLAVLAVIAMVTLAINPQWTSERPVPVSVTFADLGGPYEAATIRGTAHYSVVIEQTVPGTLVADEQHYWLYGLFPEHDTSGRAIQLLVRSPVAPEDMVSFEYVELTGRISKPTRYNVPPQTEEFLYRQSDYFFAGELWVMEPWQTRSYEPGSASTPAPPDTDAP